jgi:hypothetical protein
VDCQRTSADDPLRGTVLLDSIGFGDSLGLEPGKSRVHREA